MKQEQIKKRSDREKGGRLKEGERAGRREREQEGERERAGSRRGWRRVGERER